MATLPNCNLKSYPEVEKTHKVLERAVVEGENPVHGVLLDVWMAAKSRVVWDCSPKWEVNFF